MAIGTWLIFEGTGWPTARVVNTTPTAFKFDAQDPKRFTQQTILTIAATGHGRYWMSERPQGFWRDFTEIDPADAAAVPTFVARRGDPDGLLSAKSPIHTGPWYNLRDTLGRAALAWEPEDAAGVSRITTDRARLHYADYFLENSNYPAVLRNLEPVLDPIGTGFALRARTLAAFMMASAVSALERRIDLRRCAHCRSWLELNRKDIRFCSGSCRTFHSQKKEKP